MTGGDDDVEYDWIVVGSGFGGSVAALRLAEQGHRVLVLECGRRFADHEHARSTWDLRRYFWAPSLGLRGIMRLSLFRDVFIATGAGVGGGSLGYANTLYRPNDEAFYEAEQWAGLADWKSELAPHYDTAEHMLGVAEYGPPGVTDELIRTLGRDLGVEHTFRMTRVGVFLGEPGVEVDDPYFGGEGPRRSGCQRCGACMIGCRHNAKNTLVKNYLWFAERAGATIVPEREVTHLRPLDERGKPDVDATGEHGWQVETEHPGAWLRRRRRTYRARRGVVVAAGALGSTRLLLRQRAQGTLPRLSDRLGHLVRTNSESILAVTAPGDGHDFSQTVAISSSIYPDPHTHVEPVTYGAGGGAIGLLSTLMVGGGTRVTRPLKFLGQCLRHPIRLAKVTWPHRWSRRSFLVLVMQSHENAIRLVARRRWLRRGISLRTKQDAGHPNPTFLPIANESAMRLAKMVNGIPQSSLTEALFNVPTTAHLLGGCTIGRDRDSAVVDASHRVFGYDRLLVVDGSTMPANVGVNPSLTITAMAERAMQLVAESERSDDPVS
ncbi:MAG: GMC family oxidoreductase [Thermoleophilia bacterium]|nr:GMC family oxidoreductase [Thermoleophilia bacterium]